MISYGSERLAVGTRGGISDRLCPLDYWAPAGDNVPCAPKSAAARTRSVRGRVSRLAPRVAPHLQLVTDTTDFMARLSGCVE